MDTVSLRKEYLRVNKSFKKKLVFHLGFDAGFFSEYNNMILAMLYCYTNKIQFVLYSKDSNFGYNKGWSDYFLPFADEVEDSFHSKYNIRNYDFLISQFNRTDRFKIRTFKFLEKIDFLTQDLWLDIRDKANETRIYNIPELDIYNCSLRETCQKFIDITWQYNPETKVIVENTIDDVVLPNNYLGMHIRRGDKHTEQNLFNISEYMEKAESYVEIRNLFILTDDYRVIIEIKQFYPQWSLYTFCKESEVGYEHKDFKAKDKLFIKSAYETLFASIDILSKSKCFIGSFSSNPGMFLGMKMDKDKSIGVDLDWQIW